MFINFWQVSPTELALLVATLDETQPATRRALRRIRQQAGEASQYVRLADNEAG